MLKLIAGGGDEEEPAGMKAAAIPAQLPVARPLYMVCHVMLTGEVPVVT
jgi:hypothetical protein